MTPSLPEPRNEIACGTVRQFPPPQCRGSAFVRARSHKVDAVTLGCVIVPVATTSVTGCAIHAAKVESLASMRTIYRLPKKMHRSTGMAEEIA